jgi:hypothetical protein
LQKQGAKGREEGKAAKRERQVQAEKQRTGLRRKDLKKDPKKEKPKRKVEDGDGGDDGEDGDDAGDGDSDDDAGEEAAVEAPAEVPVVVVKPMTANPGVTLPDQEPDPDWKPPVLVSAWCLVP